MRVNKELKYYLTKFLSLFIVVILLSACNLNSNKISPEVYIDFSSKRIFSNDTSCLIHICTYDFGINGIDKQKFYFDTSSFIFDAFSNCYVMLDSNMFFDQVLLNFNNNPELWITIQASNEYDARNGYHYLYYHTCLTLDSLEKKTLFKVFEVL
jgi:hypothetical protein